MSGGSYDYLYNRVEEMADTLRSPGQTPMRKAFGEHLRLVAIAMHDVEWVDSGDMVKGDDIPAIVAVLGKSSKELELRQAIKDAEASIALLRSIMSSIVLKP